MTCIRIDKRSILETLADGTPRTITAIIESMNTHRTKSNLNKARTVMGRCFNDGSVCEVLPREGRQKLWHLASSLTIDEVRKEIPPLRDGKTVTLVGTNRPDSFRFHEDSMFLIDIINDMEMEKEND